MNAIVPWEVGTLCPLCMIPFRDIQVVACIKSCPFSWQQYSRAWRYHNLLTVHPLRDICGCSPWGRWESDRTERLPFHFSSSCIGEGNGNPLQCSCLENPRDGRAGWAAVYGVTQSWTRLKWLSSSSSRPCLQFHSHIFLYLIRNKVLLYFRMPW